MKQTFFLAHILVVGCLIGWPLPVVGDEVVELKINDVTGLDEPWPMIGGVPFPEGLISDEAKIRVVTEGREVPVQIDVTSRYRDGSIRWALLGMTATPQQTYHLEFGDGVSRSFGQGVLGIDSDESGAVRIDTGRVVYEFHPGELLPRSARMEEAVLFDDSGDGAYLIDNQGRMARVAGKAADVRHEVLKQGPQRVVVRREGWYVTDDGERIARARAWFYFAADSPYVRIMHSLIFTEDTNELWVRDYGLDFRTPDSPEKVSFAMGMSREQLYGEAPALLEPDHTTVYTPVPNLYPDDVDARSSSSYSPHLNVPDAGFLLAGERTWEDRIVTLELDGGEVYLFQETYPQFFEHGSRAVIGRSPVTRSGPEARAELNDSFWVDEWEEEDAVAGDWGDGVYGGHGLTVVMPWLAARFPKEIAFRPGGFRVAFWSSRGGRELDLRTSTLIAEMWRDAAESLSAPRGLVSGSLAGLGFRAGEGSAGRLATFTSNAQGAARTHDIWLLPRHADEAPSTVQVRAETATHPPLLHADPVWAAATEAIGWRMHPKDTEAYADQEASLEEYWQTVTRRNRWGNSRPLVTGFIYFGRHTTIRAQHNAFFRFGRLADYHTGERVWPLFVRSGDRTFYEYGTRFNQFAADWHMAHIDTPAKFTGGWHAWDNYPRSMLPFHWGDRSSIVSAKDPRVFLWEYFHNGNEYSREVFELTRDAVLEHWNADDPPMNEALYRLVGWAAYFDAYGDQSGEFLELAGPYVERGVDLENVTGLTDQTRYGPIYKSARALASLYDYYLASGDELARDGFLKRLDYKYRFSSFGLPFGNQELTGYLFALGYGLTGDPNYLRVANYVLELGSTRHQLAGDFNRLVAVQYNWHIMQSMPAALAVVENHADDIAPYPVVFQFAEPTPSTIIFRKDSSAEPVVFRATLHMDREDARTSMEVRPFKPDGTYGKPVEGVGFESEVGYIPPTGTGRSDGDLHSVTVTLPGGMPEGDYALLFPGAQRVTLFESGASETGVYAPEGFQLRGDGGRDYFHVGDGIEELKLVYGRHADSRTRISGVVRVYRPDGDLAAELGSDEEVVIPTEGQAGDWSIVSTRDGVYVKLLNAPPVFSRSPDWLPRVVTTAPD